MDRNCSLCEKAAAGLAQWLKDHSLPFAASLVFGLLAHMYAFSNKLLNADETSALFSKGASVTSGRWGLELTAYIFPDVSMPWIYGVISLVLIAVAVCLTVDIFRIKSPLLQGLLGGVMLSFPAILGNFCFMFTSASYALAIFLAVLSVYLFTRGSGGRTALGVALLAVSLGIYQAYISLAAGYLVLCLIQSLLDGDKAGEVLKRGVVYLLLLAAALGLYYAVNFLVNTLGGHGYQEYGFMSEGGLVSRLIRCYSSFAGTVFRGYFGYVNSRLSMLMHLCILAVSLAGIILAMARDKDWSRRLLTALLLIVLPLSLNCMYLIASVDIIHSLVLYSFVCVYILAAIVLDRAEGRLSVGRDTVSLALAFILAGNIFYCNKVYLKMALQYEHAYAFYTTLMAQIMETPGFSEYTIIDFVGNNAAGVKTVDEIDTAMLTGPNDDLVNTYTRVYFMKYYLGMDLFSYREDTILKADWYDEMPCYPDEGSILMRPEENRIIVKLD